MGSEVMPMRFLLLLLLSGLAVAGDGTSLKSKRSSPDPFAGWAPTAQGWAGTGEHFGSGYQVDRRTGVVSGTGDRFGERWVPDGHGGYRQEGRAFRDGR